MFLNMVDLEVLTEADGDGTDNTDGNPGDGTDNTDATTDDGTDNTGDGLDGGGGDNTDGNPDDGTDTYSDTKLKNLFSDFRDLAQSVESLTVINAKLIERIDDNSKQYTELKPVFELAGEILVEVSTTIKNVLDEDFSEDNYAKFKTIYAYTYSNILIAKRLLDKLNDVNLSNTKQK